MSDTMKALKTISAGKAVVKSDVPIPKLRPDRVLVKNVALALNPTDWKHIVHLATENSTVGCDCAGVVEAVGGNLTKPYKKGDRIAGFCHGGKSTDLETGAFGEYCLPKSGVSMKIPDNVSFEEAATLGVGITTVGQGLYQSLQLPWPDKPANEKFPVLIYGGSTATGTLAIQMAKLSGLDVITTCSPRNFDLVKSLGASVAFDYSSPSCGADIRKHTNNRLYYAFDCISEGSSPQICADALSSDVSSKKPEYSALLRTEIPRDDVEHKFTLGYTAIGEAFSMQREDFPDHPDHYEFASKFWTLAQKLLEQGKFKVHPMDVRSGGLEGINDGLEDLRDNKVSGKKLVYHIA